MIRDRFKKRLRGMALRAFGMERQAEARTTRKTTGSDEYDPSVIPPLVDGDGDTPGPNHKEKIGRTWLAAQLNGGDAGTVIDIRPPQEWIVGTLPNALLVPGDQILRRTDLLPPKTRRVTLVDATHEQEAFETAKTLRDQGWTWARSLQGGWAEWVEQGETQVTPPRSEGRWQLADPIEHDGRRGVIQALREDSADILYDNGDFALEVPLQSLS